MHKAEHTRRNFIKTLGAGLAAGVLSRLSSGAEPEGEEPPCPNFIIIFIDDMGYGEIGPFGSKKYKTPHLDRMAKEGLKLTSFYVAAPVCTPSRAALMTGCYPKRVGLHTGSNHVVLFPGDAHGLHPDEITIPEILKKEGYVSGCFGKWHLGDQPEFLPTSQGFDTYYGIPYSNDMWTEHPQAKKAKTGIWNMCKLPIVRDTKVEETVDDMAGQAQLCKKFTDEAVKFIRKNKDEKFFVYLTHAFMHHPRAARKEFMEKAGGDATKAQIDEIDWSVGQILDTIRELKLEKDTLVFFTSDNGGTSKDSGGPLKGKKGQTFEGGMREPAIAWWPFMIQNGKTTDELATAMDFLPTFAKLAGARLPGDRIIDGKDISQLLMGIDGVISPHDCFFYYKQAKLMAVRAEKWKLHTNGELYNLEKDIGETKDVAKDNPRIVEWLDKFLKEAREDLGDGNRPGKNCRPVGKAKNPKTLLPRNHQE